MLNEVEEINVLLERIANEDDESALEELFYKTKDKLSHIAKEYLIEKSYCEDILSESYVKIYKKAHMYKKSKNGYNWMHEIVKNTARDFNRRYLKQQQAENEEMQKLSTRTENRIKNKSIEQALKVLDDREYQVVYLRIWENKTLEGIAEELKYNTTGVYRIYNQALEKLRKELEESYF